MKIEFDSYALEYLKITPVVACLAVLLDSGVELPDSCINELRKANIMVGNNVSKVALFRLQGKITYDVVDDTIFNELLAEYPKFDNSRPLHDTSEKVKAKYLRRMQNDLELHNKVLEAIRREIKHRHIRFMKGEFVEAWKSLSKYIETEGWNRYLEELPPDKITLGTGYGEQEL